MKEPKTFTLSGRELACFRSGERMGASRMSGALARDITTARDHIAGELERLRGHLRTPASGDAPIPDGAPAAAAVDALPTLMGALDTIIAGANAESGAQQSAANQMMGKLAARGEAQDARWRPPLRAWGMLALAMIPAVTVATVAALWVARAGW